MACHWWKYCAEHCHRTSCVQHTYSSVKKCLLLHLLVSAAWHWWVVQVSTRLKVKFMYRTRCTTTDNNSNGLHIQHKHTLQHDVL
jgi:hypothetical protein